LSYAGSADSRSQAAILPEPCAICVAVKSSACHRVPARARRRRRRGLPAATRVGPARGEVDFPHTRVREGARCGTEPRSPQACRGLRHRHAGRQGALRADEEAGAPRGGQSGGAAGSRGGGRSGDRHRQVCHRKVVGKVQERTPGFADRRCGRRATGWRGGGTGRPTPTGGRPTACRPFPRPATRSRGSARRRRGRSSVAVLQ